MARGQTIARNSLLLAVAHGASKVFSVALTAIAGRILGPAGYGFYATGSALVEVGRIVAAGGLDYLVAREVVSNPDDSSRIASNASALKIVLGVVTYALLLGLVVGLRYPDPVLTVVLILGSALFFENLSDVLDAVFQGHERVHITTIAFAVGSAVTFGAGAMALTSGYGLVGYCLAFVGGFVVRWVLVIALGARAGMVRLRAAWVESAELRRMARVGAPLLGATVVSLLFHRVDILMLGKLVSESEVGLYAAAVRIIDVVVLAPRILATAVYPAMRRSRDEDGPAATAVFVGDSTRLSLILCSAIGLGVWILAPLALRWIPGEAFLPATPALRILSFGIVLQSASYMIGRLLFADERETDFLWIGGISLAMNVVLNSILIPRMGIDGAAWATVAAYSANATLYFVFARRRGFPLPLHRSLLGPVLAVAVASTVAWMLADRPWVVPASTLLGTWLVVLVVQGILRPADLVRGRDLLRRGSE